MSKKTRISRRQFIALTAVTAGGAVVAACGGTPTATPVPPTATKPPAPAAAATTAPAAAAPTATKAPVAAATTAPTPLPAAAPTNTPAPISAAGKYKEAPMLAELVKAGKLPPVEQRLPPSPVVVKPTNKIGKYGGTLNAMAQRPEAADDHQIGNVAGLIQFSNDLSTTTMMLADSITLSPDNKSCVVNLRKGVKWSDGSPFTSADLSVYFDDFQFNKDLTPTLPSNWQPGKQPMTITYVDQYTVKFDFAVPYPAFPLIQYSGSPIEAWRPKKWADPYHIKYNPNADVEAKAAGFTDWKQRWLKLLQNWNYGVMPSNIPFLGGWRPVEQRQPGRAV